MAGIVIAFYIIFDIITHGKLLTFKNIENIIYDTVFPCFVVWGMLFIYSTGIVDLSIGATIIFASNVGALLVVFFGWGYLGLIVPTVLSAVVLELVMVLCTVFLHVSSWVASLGLLMVFESACTTGLSLLPMLKGTNLIDLGKNCRIFINFQAMVIAWIIGMAVVYFLFERTSLSFNMQAVGDNPGVAAAMGINVKKTMLLSAVVGAVFIGVGSFINLSHLGVVIPASGLSSLGTIFQPLAIMMLAASFSRVVNRTVGVFIGAFVVESLFNALTILGVPGDTWQNVVLGVLVISCGVLANLRFKGVVK